MMKFFLISRFFPLALLFFEISEMVNVIFSMGHSIDRVEFSDDLFIRFSFTLRILGLFCALG